MILAKNNFILLIKDILAFFSLFFITLSISILFTLNLIPLYALSIPIFNITDKVSLSFFELICDYFKLISYLQNPFIKELYFEHFPISPKGRYHFYEVKGLFLLLYIILFISILMIMFILNYNKKHNLNFSLSIFTHLFYSTLLFNILIFIGFKLNFSFFFKKFHNIFFNNNYWLFNPYTDPIINALPEKYFMLCSVIVFLLIPIQPVIAKKLLQRNKLKKA